MDENLCQAIVAAFNRLPPTCRDPPAEETQLLSFEQEFGPIPPDFRWFLAACGGGVCGREWIDGIEELTATHRKFHAESGPGGWSMCDVFIIGWDGYGNPYGIHWASGSLLVEDHNFGGVHKMAESLSEFLAEGFEVRT